MSISYNERENLVEKSENLRFKNFTCTTKKSSLSCAAMSIDLDLPMHRYENDAYCKLKD